MWYCQLFRHNLTSIGERCFTDVSAGKGVYIHTCRCGLVFLAHRPAWFSDKLKHRNWGTDLYFEWVNRARYEKTGKPNSGRLLLLAILFLIAVYTLTAFTRY